jgi:transposase
MNTNEITDGITTGLELRKQRGLEMAAMFKIVKRKDGSWAVPSQSGTGRYAVSLGDKPNCDCPDHQLRGCVCKHIHAVRIVVKREQHDDGTETVTQSITVTESVKRPTYGQCWSAYNEAQTTEKSKFQSLLHDLCEGIPEPEQIKGRRRIPLRDAVFAAAFKVFSTVSGRRFISDLCDAQTKGYIEKVPHFNSIFNALENPAITPVLLDLIIQSSLPLKSVETDFAVDSTSFTTSRFVRWFNVKHGRQVDNHVWRKAHLAVGVKTNIVTAVKVTDGMQNDCNHLPELVDTTAQNFAMTEVSADKGYAARTNYNAIEKHGATPFIAFKKNATGKVGGVFAKMFHFYSFQREEFLEHYHKRSNIESTCMMIKTKFGDGLRSKGEIAQENEILCKILCHNICCVIQSMHELGIEPNFGMGK